MPFKDPIKKKEFDKQYRIKNKQKLLENAKLWKRKNKQKISEANKIYRDNNKDKLKNYYIENKEKIIIKSKEYYKNNKDKLIKKSNNYYVENKPKILLRNKLKKYRLTKEDYEWLLLEQNNKCAICLEETKLCIDHDHKTGKVRGLLCGHCNKVLGFLREDTTLLDNIKNYLK